MDVTLSDLGIQAPDWIPAVKVSLRLVVAALLGGLLGWDRERRHRAAGFRTHILIAMGAALFTAVPLQVDTDDPGRLHSELVRGIAAGIGFLGAGAILKMSQRREIRGLTTAASVWTTAAIGFSAGAGWITVAVVAALFSWVVLKFLRPLSDTSAHDVRQSP